MIMTKENSNYIGDGVYVGHDGFSLWLHANSHSEPTDVICLEPEVLKAFVGFAKRVGMIK